MAWRDIFRKKEEKENEKVSFSQLSEKLKRERKKIDDEKLKAKKEIINEINKLNLEIKEKISGLEKVNIDSKKEEERIKLIVKENLRHYIDYLNRLVSSLKNSETLEPEEYFKSIDQSFYNFSKNSKMAFEKATILIGREIGEAKETVNSACRNINSILKSRTNAEKEKLSQQLEKMLESMDDFDECRRNSEIIAKELVSMIEEMENKRKQAENEIEKIRKSEEYAQFEEEKEERKMEKQELERDILKIKENIDLKHLAKFFHNDPKKSEIIKKYLENFGHALKYDSNLEIISLGKEAGKNMENMEEIRARIEKSENQVISGVEEKLKEEKQGLGKISMQIIRAHEEIGKEKDKIARFEEKKKHTKKEIRERAKLLDFEIID